MADVMNKECMEDVTGNVKRGGVFYANLPEQKKGSIQAGVHPVVVIQCNRLNRNSPTVSILTITSKLKRPNDEAHVVLPQIKGLPKQSMVLAEQPMTINKFQLFDYRGTLDENVMRKVTKALHNATKADYKSKDKCPGNNK